MDKIKIAITTGDLDGIGFEVAAKAINLIGPQKNIQFILWRSPKASSKFIKLLDQKFKRVTVKNIDEALAVAQGDQHRIERRLMAVIGEDELGIGRQAEGEFGQAEVL